jgi:hypothetical protein
VSICCRLGDAQELRNLVGRHSFPLNKFEDISVDISHSLSMLRYILGHK